MSWGFAFRVRQQLKGSLWVIPFLAAVLGPVLAQLTVLLDRSIQVPEAWQYSASTATGVLSVLVGAMVGLIGFVVTIGVLVVQLATGTLSPRFMRLWYRDPLQKVVLAMFAGTLTFSFSLLRHVEEASVPNIGVTAAGLLVAASLLLLLLYLDRFTHSLRPVAVAALVADAGRRVIETMTRSSRYRSWERRTAGRPGSAPPSRPWWYGRRGRAPSRRSTAEGCWRSPAGTTASWSCSARWATSSRREPAWYRCSGRHRPPPSGGCGGCSPSGASGPSSRTRPSRYGSWSTSRSGRCHRPSTTRRPRSRCSTTSKTSSW